MAIAASDILFFEPAELAEGTGHGGTSTASELATTKNALWDDVDGSEALDGDNEYRKIFVGLHNDVGSEVLSSVKIWVPTNTPGGDEMQLKMSSAAGDSNNVQTDITGIAVTWSAPSVKSDGVDLDNLVSGDAVGVWLRRSVPASTTAYADNSATIRVEGS
jgi:hypothetical protein